MKKAILAPLIAAFLYSGVVPSTSGADAPDVIENLKELNDPTILKSRVWLDYEWNQYEAGVRDDKLTLGALWGLRVTDRMDWGFRLKVPYVWHTAGETFGDTDESGCGDIEVATGAAFHLSKTWRTGGGVELHMDSASNHVLGDKAWRLKPFWAIAWDAAEWLTLGFSVEQNDSFQERKEVDPQNYTELFFPVTFILPHSWAITAQYKGKIDYESSDKYSHTLKLGIAKRLERIPLSLSASIEKELDGGEKKFQANFVATWFFQ
jgi:hypothetical protein